MTAETAMERAEKPQAVSPCPFHGTLCEYVPMAHSAPAMAEELDSLRALNEKLVEALHKYGEHKLWCKTNNPMTDERCDCGLKVALLAAEDRADG